MKKETLFLKIVLLALGLVVAALCVAIPIVLRIGREVDGVFIKYPILLGLYVTAAAFFVALYQTMKLLKYIDTGNAFSVRSVSALSVIKRCAVIIGVLYTLGGLPFSYFAALAEADNAPEVFVIVMIFTFASYVIAVFASVLQKLLAAAISIKEENDLTV
ncbi:membrane protein [Spirochaetia bacterium]|nr:membrane protein [Spirochaetia bacterium]